MMVHVEQRTASDMGDSLGVHLGVHGALMKWDAAWHQPLRAVVESPSRTSRCTAVFRAIG
jgi:hypothetical protein